MAISNLAYGIFLICYTEGSSKRTSQMPLKKFIENSRGINAGKDIQHAKLENLYEKTAHTGLRMNAATFPIKKCGWMSKQGMDLLKMWKKRWFLLSGSQLHFFKKPGVSSGGGWPCEFTLSIGL